MRFLAGATFLSAILLATAGCAHKGQQQSSGEFQNFSGAVSESTSNAVSDGRPIITPDNGLNGKVASVNPDLRFVVLTFPVGRMPAVNSRLAIYRSGLKVAEVNITGPQRDDSIVADVLAGEVTQGDEVRSQ